MIEIKALIVILALSLPVFWLARKPACEFACDPADFSRRRNLWLVLTVLAFTANNFWVYIVGASFILMIGARREPNRLALFLALLMVLPAFTQIIPGFAGIQHFVGLSHVRMLSIVLLLPAYLTIRREPGVLPFGRTMADKCLFAYLAMQFLLQIGVISLTATARYTIYSFIDVFLPYYVASRGLRDLHAYRDTVMAWVMAIVVMAPIALFEYFRHWLLYGGLATAMGVVNDYGVYMMRGETLRAVVSGEHSIVLGYVVAVALGLLLYVRRLIANRMIFALAFVLLAGALIAAGARGPWVGTAAVMTVVLLTGPAKLKRTFRVGMIAIPLLVLLSFTQTGGRLFELLPFIGTVDTDSIDYRRRLFDTSMLVIRQNPWFGSFDYLVNPAMQEMIQGEGIIDVVNSFLGVALTFGYVGLSLFCGVFVFAAWGVSVGLRNADPESELSLLGRSLLATLAGVVVCIITLSSIGVVPWVYWTLAGLCVGYAQLAALPVTRSTETEMRFDGSRVHA